MSGVGQISAKFFTKQSDVMSGQRYAQATSEESTQLVTNRTTVNPAYRSEHLSLEPQASANLTSNFNDLHLSSHSSSFAAPIPSQLSAGMLSSPNVHSESRGQQNTEVSESRQAAAAAPDQHLR